MLQVPIKRWKPLESNTQLSYALATPTLTVVSCVLSLGRRVFDSLPYYQHRQQYETKVKTELGSVYFTKEGRKKNVRHSE